MHVRLQLRFLRLLLLLILLLPSWSSNAEAERNRMEEESTISAALPAKHGKAMDAHRAELAVFCPRETLFDTQLWSKAAASSIATVCRSPPLRGPSGATNIHDVDRS